MAVANDAGIQIVTRVPQAQLRFVLRTVGGSDVCIQAAVTKVFEVQLSYVLRGGKRCRHLDCNKGAQCSTLFCFSHGGGKRCLYPGGCDNGASLSVNNSFCRAHGGGRRCKYNLGCTKHIFKDGMCKQHGVAAGLWK